ncbi:MAG: glycosyltransferase family 4 protein [Thermosphaera sp.]
MDDEGRDGPEGIHIQPIAERGMNLNEGAPAGEEGIKLEKLGHKAKFTKVLLLGFSDFSLGRGLYIAKALSHLGLDVTAITNEAIYISDTPPESQDSGVKLIKFRIPLPRNLYNSIFGRLFFYVVFTILSFPKVLITKPQLLYSRGPHPFTELICVIYKFFNKNVKIISDTTDLWPDVLRFVKVNKIVKNLLIYIGHAISMLLYSNVDAIVTLNEPMARIFSKRFKRDTYVLYGVIDLNKFKPIDRATAKNHLPENISKIVEEKFVVLYAGVMSDFQDPAVISTLADEFKNNDDVVFLTLGNGYLKCKLIETSRKRFIKNLFIFDPLPHDKMPFVYSLADVVILPPPVLSSEGVWEYFVVTLPKKFIEYAACGKPILCLTPPCVASMLCTEWKAGYHIPPNDYKKASEIIRILKEDRQHLESLGRNARRMAEELFSLSKAVGTLKEIIEKLT